MSNKPMDEQALLAWVGEQEFRHRSSAKTMIRGDTLRELFTGMCLVPAQPADPQTLREIAAGAGANIRRDDAGRVTAIEFPQERFFLGFVADLLRQPHPSSGEQGKAQDCVCHKPKPVVVCGREFCADPDNMTFCGNFIGKNYDLCGHPRACHAPADKQAGEQEKSNVE